MLDRGQISETAWKWRCKIKQSVTRSEKTASDFSTDDSSIEAAKVGQPGGAGTKEGPAKDNILGSNPSVKMLYEKYSCGEDYVDWVDYPPKQLSKTAARAQDRVAIKLYKVKDKDKPVISGRFTLKYHRIDIQNPALVAALEPILKKEECHLDANETATFMEPFRPLYFCQDQIVAKYRSLADGDALKPFMHLLVKVLDDVFSDLKAKTMALKEKGLISFKTAWTFFPRDSIVISYARNCEMLCKVVDTTVHKDMGGASLVISCKVMRFNGEAFLWDDHDVRIPAFGGNLPVLDLPHYPLDFHPDADQVKSRMVSRGARVLDYQGLTYCCYTGLGIRQAESKDPGEKDSIEKHNVDGRVLIDVVGYKKHHLAQGVREDKDPRTTKNKVQGTGRTGAAPGKETAGKNSPTPSKRLTEEEQAKNKQAMLHDEDSLMCMYPLLEGYALKNKLWMNFYIEDITPMVWNDEAYEHLVYDEQQKDLVLSFVENHTQNNAQDNGHKELDVIKGKGQGLIILLSGPPGTGKTLTAEAVADKTHRPLFYLQAEDLGINPAALGANIKTIFEMATEWDAVILLDEADVFMAERHPQDIARNELVSIFLRELEYYKGIIFLTTNLYDTIDSAFRSRVSLHLLFKSLNTEARLVVWQKFLGRLPKAETKALASGGQGKGSGSSNGGGGEGTGAPDGGSEEVQELTQKDIKELAGWQLNGREIKNAVRMVQSWCTHKGYSITLDRLESGIKVTSPHASKQTEHDTSLYDDE
ncbi:hypothetical protein MAPG_01068 [Magnaporthiopsis poae ATCC 64411]|uniref:AAA+ ATPase domain-containing protein n=1 Tax=Magnaporthiopsis poae (strain ATCC 64411 / 73-15) TaxID=644358 RepID=A0A0C4DMQ6_MAGP6|nr:hypothetical protein MAPG_01068 [Magnaporthiopsis poae ATCC 64411]